jgi:methylmalonyl-CoA mutase N-terminal domain/subunit
MSAPDNSNARPDTPALEGGVLAALPRTRPQRASARRAAARGKAAKSETAATTGTTKKATKVEPTKKTTPTKKTEPTTKTEQASRAPAARARTGNPKRRQPRPTTPSEPPAPRQGYEPEEDLELGNTVNPPSGVELLESLTDIMSELAGSTLTAGGRLLKDAFSILRRP